MRNKGPVCCQCGARLPIDYGANTILPLLSDGDRQIVKCSECSDVLLVTVHVKRSYTVEPFRGSACETS